MNESIPASLLLLSRTLFMSPTVAVDEQLKVTISQLPERIIDEMEVKIGATEGESVDPQTIIDIIKHEEELIKAEKQEKEEVLKDTAEKVILLLLYCYIVGFLDDDVNLLEMKSNGPALKRLCFSL